jgi:hypothetical protein
MRDDDTVIPIDPDLSPTDPGEPVLGRRRHVPRRRHGRARPDVLAVIALGGMLGAAARFKLAEALPARAGHFPWATFWTSLSGSFLLGFLLILLLERFPPTRYGSTPKGRPPIEQVEWIADGVRFSVVIQLGPDATLKAPTFDESISRFIDSFAPIGTVDSTSQSAPGVRRGRDQVSW